MEPIIVKYRLTPEELAIANIYLMKRQKSSAAKITITITLCLFVGFYLIMIPIYHYRPKWEDLVLVPILVGILWFLTSITNLPRRTEKRLDLDNDVEYQVFSDKIVSSSQFARSELIWQLITEVIRTRQGFLLKQLTNLFFWLPYHGFGNEQAITEFDELVRSRVKRYRVMR